MFFYGEASVYTYYKDDGLEQKINGKDKGVILYKDQGIISLCKKRKDTVKFMVGGLLTLYDLNDTEMSALMSLDDIKIVRINKKNKQCTIYLKWNSSGVLNKILRSR